MPTALQVETLTFTFPDGWDASKYDDWSFYRNQFSRQFSGIKGVDLVACSPDETAYLIEVKDYRHPDTEKPSELPQAIASKVLMTLSALLPASIRGNKQEERDLAARLCRAQRLRVFAHIELPRAHMPAVDPADLQQKLQQLLRAVDPHAKVVSTVATVGTGWTVA